MNQERDTFVDEGVDLREIFLVLLRKWWVVVAVLIVSVAVAWVSSGRMPDVYQARTQLLLVSRTSSGLTGSGAILPDISSALSADTLSNLALANDLLENIVQTLSRDYPGSGSPASADALAGMMKVDIKTSAQNKTTVLPLLTLTVRGGDPILLKRIAETWANLFIQRNVSLFASELARSFDYIQAQYLETETTLNRLEDERKNYLIDNPLPLLNAELKVKQSDLQKYLATLLDTSAQLSLQQQDYEEVLAHLDELSVDGRWIGLPLDGGATGKSAGSTPEQKAVLQAKQWLLTKDEEIRNFSVQAEAETRELSVRQEEEVQGFLQDSELALLKQRLGIKGGLLTQYLTELETTENNLAIQSATLKALQAEIEGQPQVLVLKKAIDDPALWGQFGLTADSATWERLRERALLTEEVNPAFTALIERAISTRTQIATDRARVTLLTQKVKETRDEVQDLEKAIAATESEFSRLRNDHSVELALLKNNHEVQLGHMRDDLALSARQSYDSEWATYSTLQTQLVSFRNSVRQLQAQQDAYQKLVDTYRADVGALSTRIASIDLQVQQFDRQIQTPKNNLETLAAKLQEARLAKDEQSGTIRVVESPIVPQVPTTSPDRQRRVYLGAALGLLLGVMVAFLLHYLLEPPVSSSGPQRRGPATPAS